jgi:hypothetical protein
MSGLTASAKARRVCRSFNEGVNPTLAVAVSATLTSSGPALQAGPDKRYRPKCQDARSTSVRRTGVTALSSADVASRCILSSRFWPTSDSSSPDVSLRATRASSLSYPGVAGSVCGAALNSEASYSSPRNKRLDRSDH